MKKFQIFDLADRRHSESVEPVTEVEADFIYAQPSGVSTLHRVRTTNSAKSDIVAVVPANLLILEV